MLGWIGSVQQSGSWSAIQLGQGRFCPDDFILIAWSRSSPTRPRAALFSSIIMRELLCFQHQQAAQTGGLRLAASRSAGFVVCNTASDWLGESVEDPDWLIEIC